MAARASVTPRKGPTEAEAVRGAASGEGLLALQVGHVVINYVPTFFDALDTWLAALERVKWASQLGATAKLRLVHPKIYRSLDKLMREAWHKPRLLIMMAFMELADVLDQPSIQRLLSGGAAL